MSRSSAAKGWKGGGAARRGRSGAILALRSGDWSDCCPDALVGAAGALQKNCLVPTGGAAGAEGGSQQDRRLPHRRPWPHCYATRLPTAMDCRGRGWPEPRCCTWPAGRPAAMTPAASRWWAAVAVAARPHRRQLERQAGVDRTS